MSNKIKGISSVFGGFLIHLTLGTFYTVGNMNTYITSYLRKNGETSLTYSSAIWINTAFISGMGVVMFFAGLLYKKVGTSITCAIGCAIFTASTAITYFSVQSSFFLVVITYGLMPAIGSGMAYTTPLINSMKWFPHNKGIVTGITVGGFGLGALIFDQIQTLYLNPNNYSPKDDNSIYFTRDSILRKVPTVFLILSLIYGVLQLIGIAFMFDADKHSSFYESSDLIDNSRKDSIVSIQNRESRRDSIISQRHSDITPKNALKFSNFYVLWILFAFGNQITTFINTIYKPFGIDLEFDDHYLALTGSFASIFNASGRIFWGKLMDKYNFKICIITLFGMLSIFMFTFIISLNAGKVFYMIWILMIFFSFSGLFSLFPAVVAQTYGPTHANTIYGMLFTAPTVTGVLGAVILEVVINNLGWFYSFTIVGAMSLLGMIIAMFFYR